MVAIARARARARLVAEMRTNNEPRHRMPATGARRAPERGPARAGGIATVSANRWLAELPSQTAIMIRIGTTEVNSCAPSAIARSNVSSRLNPATVASTTRPAQCKAIHCTSGCSRSGTLERSRPCLAVVGPAASDDRHDFRVVDGQRPDHEHVQSDDQQ